MQNKHQGAVLGFYSRKQVSELTSLSAVTIWRLMREGKFPAPVRLSARRVAWSRSSVEAWMKTLIKEQGGKARV